MKKKIIFLSIGTYLLLLTASHYFPSSKIKTGVTVFGIAVTAVFLAREMRIDRWNEARWNKWRMIALLATGTTITAIHFLGEQAVLNTLNTLISTTTLFAVIAGFYLLYLLVKDAEPDGEEEAWNRTSNKAE